MTVYVRTEEGQLAAYSPDSALPRKLRSLLKVIDGKTSVEVYTSSLRAFGDVHGVLRSLDMAGLIRPISNSFSGYISVPAPAPAPAPVPAPAAEFDNADQPSSLWSSAKTMIRSKLSSQNFKSSQPSMPNKPSVPGYGHSAMATRDMLTGATDPEALTRAVDMMSDFVLINAPSQAMMVLKELEQLRTLEQLAVTLGGYEQVISHLGEPARAHILLVKQILRENM